MPFPPHRRHLRPGLVGLGLALTLTACSTTPSASSGAGQGATVSGASTAAASTTAPATPAASSAPATGGDQRPGVTPTPLSVLGTISSVRGDCIMFTPGDMAESWTLTGDPTVGLVAGDQVEVYGLFGDAPSAACPGARTFRVEKVTKK